MVVGEFPHRSRDAGPRPGHPCARRVHRARSNEAFARTAKAVRRSAEQPGAADQRRARQGASRTASLVDDADHGGMAQALRAIAADVARPRRRLNLARGLAYVLFGGPIAAGLALTLATAFGFLPALGGDALSLAPWRALFSEAGPYRLASADAHGRLRGDGARSRACLRPDGGARRARARSRLRICAGAAARRAPCRDRDRPRLPHRAERLADAALQPLGDGPDLAARLRQRQRRLRPRPHARPRSQGDAVSSHRRPRRAEPDSGRGANARRALARLSARGGVAAGRRAAGLCADPPAGLCGARLCAFGGRHGAGARALPSRAALRRRPALVPGAGFERSSFPAPPRRRCNSRSSSPRSAFGASAKSASRASAAFASPRASGAPRRKSPP